MDIAKYRELDLEFRRKLKAEIHKSRENLKNIIDELYEEGQLKKINSVKKVIDELGFFSDKLTRNKVAGYIVNLKKKEQ